MLYGMEPSALRELQGLGEIEQDARFREMAVRNLRADPGAALLGGLRKAGAQWSVVYNPAPVPPERRRPDRPLAPGEIQGRRETGLARYALHAASTVLLVLAALAGAALPRVRADLPVLVAVAAATTLVAAVFWGQPRYLAPLHGLGIALGAAAWAARKEPS
jgi:hypothetical protein